MVFQFTPALRRATFHRHAGRAVRPGFNSRPPCDGRLFRFHFLPSFLCFNSRPPCDGRRAEDRGACRSWRFNSRPPCDGRLSSLSPSGFFGFQFTPALRRATGHGFGALGRKFVSIHARLATGDARCRSQAPCPGVSIHARLATGDKITRSLAAIGWFQFTPALRRATICAQANGQCIVVSIHARLATGD